MYSGPNTCQCETDYNSSCLNCFRWWSAVSLESSVNYAIAANIQPPHMSPSYAHFRSAATSSNASLGSRILHAAQSSWDHAPYNAHWNATAHPVFVDDFVWCDLAVSNSRGY